MKMLINMILKVDEDMIRLLWIGSDLVAVISMITNEQPYLMKTDDLVNGFENQSISIEENYLETPILFLDNEEKYAKKRDEIWKKFKPLLEDEPNIFEKKYRREVIKSNHAQLGFTEKYISELMKKYWRGGKLKNSFFPAYYRCGAPGKERNSGEKKRGRPRKYVEIQGIGVNINSEWRKLFTIGIKKYYYSKAKNSLIMTYELMKLDYIGQHSNMDTANEFPSFAQLQYWFHKERSIKNEVQGRFSKKKYLKDFRPLLSNTNEDVKSCGTFEIDAHKADLHLVSEFNREKIIGRPTLYIVIDRFSRLVVGIYCGLEDGNYIGALMALYSTTKNKVEYCSELGIEIEEDAWPACLPNLIIGDRGEMESKNVEHIIESLGIQIRLTPSFRADLKGIVESFFALLNNNIKSILPGQIILNNVERGDRDYRLDANLTIREYTKIVVLTILYYNRKLLSNYDRTEEMIQDNIVPTPINIWNWSIANFGTTLKYADDEIKLALLPSAEASVTRHGLRFKTMFYASKNMMREGIFEKGGNGPKKIKIYFDPRNLSYVYIRDFASNAIEKCYLLPKSEKYKNKCIEDSLQLIEDEAKMQVQYKTEQEFARTSLLNNIQEVIEASKDIHNETAKKLSKRQRLSNIRENRSLDKIRNREKEQFDDLGEDEKLLLGLLNKDEGDEV